MINQEPIVTTYPPLSEDAARRRVETWQVLHDSGASLLWHPVSTDKVLNASELKAVASIEAAAEAAIESEPSRPADVSGMLGMLRGKLDGSPFWFAYLRPAAIRCMPPSMRGDSGLVDINWPTSLHLKNGRSSEKRINKGRAATGGFLLPTFELTL